MAATEIFTGTTTAAEWVQEPVADAYWITLAVDNGETIQLRGTDRLNLYPAAGQRIRIAGSVTPRGHYRVRPLRDEIDPATQMTVQVELI